MTPPRPPTAGVRAFPRAAAVRGPDRPAAPADRPGAAPSARGPDRRPSRSGARPPPKEIAP
jgi:hypothetical protein